MASDPAGSSRDVDVSVSEYADQQAPIDPRIAGYGSRLVALVLDWVLANAACVVIFRNPAMYAPPTTGLDLVPLGVYAAETVLCTMLFGGSAGQLITGIGVARLDGKRVGLWRAVVRTVLILAVIPPLVSDRERRGLHDKAAGTVVLYRRGQRAQVPAGVARANGHGPGHGG